MTKAFAKLRRFLDQERRMLLNGKFEQIEACEDRRSELLKSWADGRPDETQVIGIQHKLERNKKLLEASERGIRSAIRSVREIRTLSENFARYSPTKGRILTPVGNHNRLNRNS